jgi:formiminotetrahydrofolate cyclodeaminase
VVDRPLAQILADLSARTTTPGGGAAAALAAALAAAVTQMAARFCDDDDRLAQAAELTARLEPLAQRDADAYAAYLAAPAGAEKHVALGPAVDVPLEIAEAADAVRRLADDLHAGGDSRMPGEAMAAAEIAGAACRAAARLVLLNLGDAVDDPRAERARRLLA